MSDKLCPLRQEDMTGMGECVKERCAWWVFDEFDGGTCAIARLAKVQHHFAKKFIELKIKEKED